MRVLAAKSWVLRTAYSSQFNWSKAVVVLRSLVPPSGHMRTNQAVCWCATRTRLFSTCVSIPARTSRTWRLTIHHVHGCASQV